jgi:acetyl esterase/lipase
MTTDEQTPPFLLPFVLTVDRVEPVREGTVDWYLPAEDPGRVPAVVFVHGGPVPPWLEPKPREWPSYRAYGAWAAGAGFVGVTFDHGFSAYDHEALALAVSEIGQVVDSVRAHPRVDPDRVVLWGFSGAGMLLGPWLTEPAPWLRGVALSYPCLRPLEPVADPPVGAADAVASAGDLRLLLTRAGLERDEIVPTVTEFVAAAESAGARLDVIDVPHGHHGFDQVDPGAESQQAVRTAMSWVVDRLSPGSREAD